MKKLYTLLFIFLLSITALQAQSENSIKLKDGWKFIPGDDMKYAASSFDDSQWKSIGVDKYWEAQGYDSLDGYAWYRIKVIIPSSLKENALLKDSLEFYMGKIDDADECFLNGKLLGSNGITMKDGTKPGSFLKRERATWTIVRRYVLSVSDPRINWDKENVIAVRVFDGKGDGGIYTGDLEISMVKLSENIISNYPDVKFEYKKGNIAKSFSIQNIAPSLTITGKLTIRALNEFTGDVLHEETQDVNIKPVSSQIFSYSFKNPGNLTCFYYMLDLENDNTSFTYRDAIPYILTPVPGPKPKINGAKVYGQRPGKPFLFTVPATGKRPMTFDAVDLPKGLKIDKKTGIITGSVADKGEYNVTLIAKNKLGTAKENFKIVIGDQLALTPPMGWNSWNCWGLTVNQNKVLASAKTFKEKGLINHGWSFINIDDGWEIPGGASAPKRDDNGNIICNSKFPNMKALGDQLHALGLKFGIYSSPGPLTCGGYTASYQHELQDAQSYAKWGIDYLKYDWCSYGQIAPDQSLPELKKPYFVMDSALQKIDRDIVFSLCQYGMGNVWEWGASVGGNLWRTTGDINDTWRSLRTIGFSQVKNAPYAGPGHWNDPDMLVVGWVGWGPNLHQTGLTPDEQYTHISLWSLLSAPLLIGCDLTKLDDFTLNLLTNDEVLALDQDQLGKQATPKIIDGDIQVWVKELEDGNKAVGIFNLGDKTQKYSLDLSAIGYSSEVTIRNLWKQKDIAKFNGKFETGIPSHGVVLVKIFGK